MLRMLKYAEMHDEVCVNKQWCVRVCVRETCAYPPPNLFPLSLDITHTRSLCHSISATHNVRRPAPRLPLVYVKTTTTVASIRASLYTACSADEIQGDSACMGDEGWENKHQALAVLPTALVHNITCMQGGEQTPSWTRHASCIP